MEIKPSLASQCYVYIIEHSFHVVNACSSPTAYTSHLQVVEYAHNLINDWHLYDNINLINDFHLISFGITPSV